jgi:hypothetical protein
MSVTLTPQESAVFSHNAGKTEPNAANGLPFVGKTDSRLRDQYGRFAKHVCRHRDPRCIDDPCPAGIRWLCEERT